LNRPAGGFLARHADRQVGEAVAILVGAGDSAAASACASNADVVVPAKAGRGTTRVEVAVSSIAGQRGVGLGTTIGTRPAIGRGSQVSLPPRKNSEKNDRKPNEKPHHRPHNFRCP
jgi:hypothetical protein